MAVVRTVFARTPARCLSACVLEQITSVGHYKDREYHFAAAAVVVLPWRFYSGMISTKVDEC